MRYVQPYGNPDLDAPYINGDPSVGRMGSIPPAAAFEHPMRELVRLITSNKLSPDEEDLEQIAKAARSQRSNYCEDTGTRNSLIVVLDPPLVQYSIGLPLRIKVKFTNDAPCTINAGAGTASIIKPNGASLEDGDIVAGGLIELVYDGTNFQMINFGGTTIVGEGGGGTSETFLVNIPYTEDTSPTPNTIIANFSPPIEAAPTKGAIVMVKINNTNTGLTVMNVQGFGPRPVYALGGDPLLPLLPCDLIKEDVLVLTFDGDYWWTTPNPIINVTTVFNVANNAQLDAIFVTLGRKRILSDVNVIIQLAAGDFTPFTTYHVDASRILVMGTMLAATPTFNDFHKTGSTPAARAQDSANNIAMLRTRYGTRCKFTNADLGVPFGHAGPGTIWFTHLLFEGPNVSAGAAAGEIRTVGPHAGGSMVLSHCAIWGSGGTFGFGAVSAHLFCDWCFACGNMHNGFGLHSGASLLTANCGSYGNGESGFTAYINSSINFYYRSAIPGVPDIAATQSQFNGSYGVFAHSLSQVFMHRCIVTGNVLTDAMLYDNSIGLGWNVTTGTTSPANNTEGNFGAWYRAVVS